jgi:hypothetical protein
MPAVVKVLWAPTVEEAREVHAHVSIEAEYGAHVIEGEYLTLAHHQKDGPFSSKNSRSPCCAHEAIEVRSNDLRRVYEEEDTFVILVSHVDLDTFGGIARVLFELTGEDRFDLFSSAENFWELAEKLDLKGAHRFGYGVKATGPSTERAMYAWLQWSSQRDNQVTRPEKTDDVTDSVLHALGIINRILDADGQLLEAGEYYKDELEQLDKDTFVERLGDVIIRVGPTFTNHLYRDAQAVVAYNTHHGSVTVSVSDPDENPDVSCRDLVQSLWGDEAGGHAGIAGSPRGKRMHVTSMVEVAHAIAERLK